MPVATIIALIEEFGPGAINLITFLIKKIEAKGEVTSQEWDALTSQLNLSAADRMKAQIIAAGLRLDDPAAVALLALAK